jgi:hypothetical protein
MPVRLLSPLAPETPIDAVVEDIRPTVGEVNRAINVIARLENPGALKGGGSVDAASITGRKESAVVVPEQSVVLRPAGKVVYLIVDGKAQQQVVEVGSKQRGMIEITSGLQGRRDRGARRRRLPQQRCCGQRQGNGQNDGQPGGRAEAAMTLPELSIKRHVLAWMLSAVLVLFGVISYDRIGMDRYPYIEFPVVSISTTLKGANPDIVDTSVTNILESSVNSTPGIEHIQSTSSPGVSVIAITFGLEKKIDVAFNEVQAKVNQVLRRLPKDVDPPVVAKVETNAQPIMWLAVQGDRTQQQLNQYAINVLKKRLETIDGVGEVRLGGRRDRTIRVELLPAAWRPSGSLPRTSTTPSPRNTCSWPAVSSSARRPKIWSSSTSNSIRSTP